MAYLTAALPSCFYSWSQTIQKTTHHFFSLRLSSSFSSKLQLPVVTEISV